MKIVVIGGGGVRAPFLARSIAHKSMEIHMDEVVFMDNDRDKLNIYGKLSQVISKKINPNLSFQLTESVEEAVKNADYIITAIRVGNDKMRIIDERISLSHGVIGQETTGAAGISFAMRSIPVLIKYCEIIKKISKKNVKVFNFTNPAGIVTQTLRDLGYDFCFGICDAPTSLINSVAEAGNYKKERLSFECLGLNHFSFINSVKYDNEELIDTILENKKICEHTDLKFIDYNLLNDKKMLFNEYLYYYLYPKETFQNISRSIQIRSEVVKEINDNMMLELQSIDIETNFEKALQIYSKWCSERENSYMKNETGLYVRDKTFVFDIDDKSENGYASIALDYIDAVENDREKDIVLCTKNINCPNFGKDDVIEVTCTITKNGIRPHFIYIEDQMISELMRRMKEYEKMASKALRSHKRNDLIECLMLNPLVSSYSLATCLIDDFLEVNKKYFEERE